MDFDFTTDTITPDNGTVLTITSVGSLALPSGTTGNRPAPVAGMIRWNSSLANIEWSDGSSWFQPGTAGVSTFSAGTTGFTPSTGTSGAITLAGTLNIANGGTGQTTAAAAFNALSPITTTGDLILGNGANSATRLGVGTTGQVLTSTGTTAQWSTIAAIGTAYTATVTPNTLVSGNYYSATITHNIGTTNTVISVYDNSTNQYVIPQALQHLDANNLKITVVGNTRTYRVVIIANGSSVANTASIIKQFTFYAASLDNPNSADWAVNALAPVVSDPTYPSLLVRQFSTTSETGVGSYITVPTGATNVTFSWKGRPQTAPGVASVVQPKLYVRSIPNNSAVAAWSSAYVMSVQTVPTNAFFQYYSQATASLATYGMASGGFYLVELTLSTSPTSGTNLSGNWLMSEFSVAFT